MFEYHLKDAFAEYDGPCQLAIEAGGHKFIVDAEYHCVQLKDTNIYINGKIDPTTGLMMLFATGNPALVKQVDGVLSSNNSINFSTVGNKVHTGAVQISFPTGGQFLLTAEGFQVSYPNQPNTALSKLVIPITNLNFRGSQPFTRPDGTNTTTLPLNINGLDLNIFPENDYEEHFTDSFFTRPCKITAFIEIDLPSTYLPTNQLLEIVDNLCALLSFAKGTWITWPFYQLFDDKDNLVSEVHRRTFTTNMGNRAIISKDDPQKLKDFIETSYNQYLTLKKDYELDQTIKTIAEAKSMASFGQINGLVVATGVDLLRAKWAEKNKMDMLQDDKSFKKIEKALKRVLPRYLQRKFSLAKNIIDEMMAKLKELNRYSFRSVLDEMIKVTSAKIIPADVDAFIRSRNKLVHTGQFANSPTPEDRYKELVMLYRFSDLIVLGLLGYTL